jgi:mitogen-activated protein kinase 15
LHSGGLIHRDLKPSNILVNEACEAKLCDFGLVRSVDDVNNNDKFNMLTEYIATRWYRAPEILLASCRYSKEVDIWGFGCLAAEMAKGKPLFPGTSTINQLERVIMWTGQPTQSDI